MGRDLKLTATLDNKASKEIDKIISDLDRLAKSAGETSAKQAGQADANARKAIAAEERLVRERIRLQRSSAALSDKQERDAANRAARANANSLQQSQDMAEASLKVERKAALAEASLVGERFDRRISIERARHAQLLADLKGNDKAMEAETRRFNAVVSRIQMDQKNFPSTPFQKLLGHLDQASNMVGVRMPAAASQMASSMGTVAMVTAGAAAGIAALTAIMVPAYKAARSQDDANKKLAAVLRATGGAAGLTFEELDKMAGALQRVTDFEDDTVMGAQAMLLRFDAIGKDVFPQALKAATDLAAGTGNLEGAAESLGQALQKPEEASRKLKAMQVILSDAQKKQIELFVQAGEKGKAQQVILDAVAKSYAGNAESMSHATTKLWNKISDMAETIGGPLVTAVDMAADALNRMMEAGPSDKDAQASAQFYGAQIFGLTNVARAAADAAAKVKEVKAPAAQAAKEKPLDDDQIQRLKDLQDELARVKLDSIQDTQAKALAIEDLEFKKRVEKHGATAQLIEAETRIHAQKIFQINQEASEKFLEDQARVNEEARAAGRADKEKALSDKLKAEQDTNRRIIEQDQQTDAIRSQYADMRIAAIDDINAKERETSEKRFSDMRDAHAGNAAALTVIDQMAAADRVRIAKMEAEAKQQTMIGFVGSVGNLLATLGKKNKALAKLGQGVQIGEAIANTAVGVTKALSAAAPPWNFIMAGTVAAAGAAQVATIAQQKYATGTDFAQGGMALVGERGPEMVYLPRGSRVDTAAETRSSAGGLTHNGNVSINLNMPAGTSQEQANKIGAAVAVGYLDELKAHRKRDRDAEYYLGARR